MKLFQTLVLKTQLELLQYFFGLWYVDRQIFIIGDQELELYAMEIYFITGLSRRGERVKLSRAHIGGESTGMLIDRYCLGARNNESSKIEISSIKVIPLRTILH